MKNKSTTAIILSSWQRLSTFPGGIWLFNRLLRWLNPYSGSTHAYVSELKPGYARLLLKDRRRVRNHLDSIHALAIGNLGELTSGLALLSCLPENSRGIPTKINMEFYKKARGTLTAESHVKTPDLIGELDFEVSTEILNQENEVIARTKVNWRLNLTTAEK